MMRKQEKRRIKMHDELRLRYNEFYESKLAISLLSHPEYFNSVKKVSAAIATLISSNKEIVLNVIKSNLKIIDELRQPYFGSIYDETEYVTSSKALIKMLSILNSDNASLEQTMQIHCIFIHKIYDHLPNIKDKSEYVGKLFPSSLFTHRGRIIKPESDIKPTVELGIAMNPVFTKMLGKHDKKHLRALDKFKPDYEVRFFKDAKDKNIPVVCGPSGHTGSLLLGAKLYGDLSEDELNNYVLACFAFLTAGGNHSFYEVMAVTKLVGVDFQLPEQATEARIKFAF